MLMTMYVMIHLRFELLGLWAAAEFSVTLGSYFQYIFSYMKLKPYIQLYEIKAMFSAI